MSTRKGSRWLAAPVLVAGAVVLGASGCSVVGAAENSVCAPDLAAKAKAFEGAVEALSTVSADMKAKLAVACAGIATDLGQSPPDVGDGTGVSDDTVTSVCDMASTAIKAKIAATGHVVPVIQGGKCTVAAQAQFDCEAQCDVDGKCTTPTIEARCDPGELSGECDGTCMASAYCEGSASAAATCQGSCDATCTGTCSGNCVGTCDGNPSSTTCAGTCSGTCDKSCNGTCTGNCKIDANATVMCGASATCRGGCSVAYKNPTCEGTLKPPSCNLDAECESACSGTGTITATCSPPTIDVLVSGDTSLKNTLEKNLPAVVSVAAQAALVAKAAADVSTTAQNVVNEIKGSTGCAVIYGIDFATKLTGSVQASVSITVTVMATGGVVAAVGG